MQYFAARTIRERAAQVQVHAARLVSPHRSRRQEALLDDALMGTFPASDPVSVAFIH